MGAIPSDRRLHPRAELRLDAEIRVSHSGEAETVMVHDLSAGGAGVLTRSLLALRFELLRRYVWNLLHPEPPT